MNPSFLSLLYAAIYDTIISTKIARILFLPSLIRNPFPNFPTPGGRELRGGENSSLSFSGLTSESRNLLSLEI
jgi:hypothetical protein